jgi:predicted DNA-binding transcriptional regulator AlpA
MEAANFAPERLLPLSEVMHRTSKSRSAIYAAMRAKPKPTFPLAIKDGISSRWLESEIDAYIRLRVAERDSKAAT